MNIQPYLRPAAWLESLAKHWLHVMTGCVIVWVTSNGVEASAASLPWPWIHDAFKDSGMSWKTMLVQGVVHWAWGMIRMVHENTPSRPPFRHHRSDDDDV